MAAADTIAVGDNMVAVMATWPAVAVTDMAALIMAAAVVADADIRPNVVMVTAIRCTADTRKVIAAHKVMAAIVALPVVVTTPKAVEANTASAAVVVIKLKVIVVRSNIADIRPGAVRTTISTAHNMVGLDRSAVLADLDLACIKPIVGSPVVAVSSRVAITMAG